MITSEVEEYLRNAVKILDYILDKRAAATLRKSIEDVVGVLREGVEVRPLQGPMALAAQGKTVKVPASEFPRVLLLGEEGEVGFVFPSPDITPSVNNDFAPLSTEAVIDKMGMQLRGLGGKFPDKYRVYGQGDGFKNATDSEQGFREQPAPWAGQRTVVIATPHGDYHNSLQIFARDPNVGAVRVTGAGMAYFMLAQPGFHRLVQTQIATRREYPHVVLAACNLGREFVPDFARTLGKVYPGMLVSGPKFPLKVNLGPHPIYGADLGVKPAGLEIWHVPTGKKEWREFLEGNPKYHWNTEEAGKSGIFPILRLVRELI